ncbi:uncharacterized protein FA14DRAFT_159229 [Meira miltonrushii]|uniref:Uncharacterized protein n=1 Tax=Meira miltonrushii TaxID=1280837 RepID=A0A316VN30_9BASI|nr:uncharacterized protein FA14DRAFT_159229 [Meira miltonrushii]PWN36965.1 hypothetical protein FA14DRAFT_159229 [Meira miltonrushii]
MPQSPDFPYRPPSLLTNSNMTTKFFFAQLLLIMSIITMVHSSPLSALMPKPFQPKVVQKYDKKKPSP